MSVKLSIDLDSATFADLASLVEAARTAGISADSPVMLSDDRTTLLLESAGSPSHTRPTSAPKDSRSHTGVGPGAGTDAALKFIAQLLGEDRR